MTREQRQSAIRKVLEEEPFVTVSQLASKFGASESTIRRDLAEMVGEGLIKRTHGGAVSRIAALDTTRSSRELLTPDQKSEPRIELGQTDSDELGRIAAAASRLVNDGETVIIDSGPGMLQLARRMRATRQNLAVLTNSIEIALELGEASGIGAILTGGLVRGLRVGLVGYIAEQTLRSMRVDKLFLTAPGVDLERGLTTSHLEEISVKQAMIHAAREVILVASHQSFGKIALVPFAPISVVQSFVTGRELPPSSVSRILELGIAPVLA